MKAKHKLPPWLRPKTLPSELTVAVGWYTEGNWTKVKASAIDSSRFEETYKEWTEMAEKAFRDFRKAGANAEKFNIDSDKLLAWCFAHGKANSAASRADFVSQVGGQKCAGAA